MSNPAPGLPGGPNASDLEGTLEEEAEKPLKLRDFFWDSIVLFVVSAIAGLTAIDAISEYIRGSEVVCFFSVGPNESQISSINEYVNNFCSGSLPITEYFPAFILVHGILIAAPHYLWLNHFGGTLDFFTHLVSLLDRVQDEKTGKYPDKNFVIVEQLQTSFTTYKRNSMFRLYIGKLILQWFLSMVGLGLAIAYFTEFDENFMCPRHFEDTSSRMWPLQGQQATCVFKSLRLLAWIRIAYILLLALVVLGLTWSLIWSFSTHPTELGYKTVAIFSFQSGLSPKYYVPRLPMPKRCRSFLFRFFTSVPWLPPGEPRINTDLDLLMLKLFRTDGGLGYVLRELQILMEIKELNNNERRRLGLHLREQRSTDGGG